jgi:hypothetical protein
MLDSIRRWGFAEHIFTGDESSNELEIAYLGGMQLWSTSVPDVHEAETLFLVPSPSVIPNFMS